MFSGPNHAILVHFEWPKAGPRCPNAAVGGGAAQFEGVVRVLAAVLLLILVLGRDHGHRGVPREGAADHRGADPKHAMNKLDMDTYTFVYMYIYIYIYIIVCGL